MRISLPRLSVVHLRRRRSVLAVLAGVAVVLELAAGAGLAYVAGWSQVRAVLGDFDGIWLIALVGALLVSFAGYHYAYRGIFRVEGGPALPRRQMRAVVAAGFGGFLAHGGGALDQYALQAAGAQEDEAKARVAALGGLEHGVLAIGGCAAAIAVLVSGRGQPPMDFTLPWAVIPIPGFVIGFWAAGRYAGRFRDRSGWRRKLGIFLDSIRIIRVLFVHPLRWGSALCGMALFWAADASATWAGLAMFGLHMNAAALFVGFATGMVFTRRTGPLAGAGVLALVLPLTIWVSGAPLAAAVAGVFVYRVLALLLPMPVSLAALPTLRDMAPHPAAHAAGTDGVKEPALQPTAGNQAIRLFEVNRDGVSGRLLNVFSRLLRCVTGVLSRGCRRCGRSRAGLPGYGIRMPGGLRAWRAG